MRTNKAGVDFSERNCWDNIYRKWTHSQSL